MVNDRAPRNMLSLSLLFWCHFFPLISRNWTAAVPTMYINCLRGTRKRFQFGSTYPKSSGTLGTRERKHVENGRHILISGIPLARYALCSASHAAMFPIVGTEEPRVEKKDKAGRGPRLNKSFFSSRLFRGSPR